MINNTGNCSTPLDGYGRDRPKSAWAVAQPMRESSLCVEDGTELSLALSDFVFDPSLYEK